MRSVIVLVVIGLTGCATLPTYSSGPFTERDKDTEYAVQDRPTGFVLTVNYSRFQFLPETLAVESACRSALLSLAHDVAEQRGRKLRPIDEQRVRITTARNPWAGVTSCTAQVPVEYQ